jgi:hypothetical protein
MMTNDHDRKVLAAADDLEHRMNELSTGVAPDTDRGVTGWAQVLDRWVDMLDRGAAGEARRDLERPDVDRPQPGLLQTGETGSARGRTLDG